MAERTPEDGHADYHHDDGNHAAATEAEAAAAGPAGAGFDIDAVGIKIAGAGGRGNVAAFGACNLDDAGDGWLAVTLALGGRCG